MSDTMTEWPAGTPWRYDQRITCDGVGTMVITFTPGEGDEFMIQDLHLIAGNWAASRAVTVEKVSAAGKRIGLIGAPSLDDQQGTVAGPGTAGGFSSGSYLGLTDKIARMVSGTDMLKISVNSPANLETLDILMRLRIKGTEPTILITNGAAGAIP